MTADVTLASVCVERTPELILLAARHQWVEEHGRIGRLVVRAEHAFGPVLPGLPGGMRRVPVPKALRELVHVHAV